MEDLLIQKLEKRDALSAVERQALSNLDIRTRTCRIGNILVGADDPLVESTLLLEGFTARTKTLRDGKRQIVAVHLSGDFADLHAFLLKRIDHSIEALTPCTIARVSHKDLDLITGQFPHLTWMLWLGTTINAAIHRTWLVAMRRLSSTAQMARFVCGMFLRLQVIGRVVNANFRLPLTRAELGDVLGLSSMHVNRVIQEMRARNLLQWQDQVVAVLDWGKLSDLAEFDPTYLSLQHIHR